MKQVLIKRIKRLFTVKTLLWSLVFVFLVFSFMMFADTLALFEDNAQALSNFDTLCAPFVKKDHLTYNQVKKYMQSFIFHMNVFK